MLGVAVRLVPVPGDLARVVTGRTDVGTGLDHRLLDTVGARGLIAESRDGRRGDTVRRAVGDDGRAGR